MRKLKNGLVTDIDNDEIIRKLEVIPIPSVLKKKLVIGDDEQIEALKELEDKISIYEYADEDDGCGLYKYEIEVHVEGSMTVEVEADDDDEAKRIAEDDIDIGCMDIDVTDCVILKKKPF